jgi:hypothetical protein
MKNQSFHRRKIRMYEAPIMDFEQLKTRTIGALNKLGQQKFSTEPGGYALENWIRGLNVLLDDFEKKVGGARLSHEYLASRRELYDRLSRPAPISSVDEEVSELRIRMSDIESKVKAERTLSVSRISELTAEQAKCSGELEREQRRVASATAVQSSDSLLGRILGRRKAATEDPNDRIKELESKLVALQDDAAEQRKQLRMIDLRSPESRFAEQWSQLEGMQTKLRELEGERLDRIQFVKERAEATRSIADAISRML